MVLTFYLQKLNIFFEFSKKNKILKKFKMAEIQNGRHFDIFHDMSLSCIICGFQKALDHRSIVSNKKVMT